MLVLMTAMNGVFLTRLLLFYIFFELTPDSISSSLASTEAAPNGYAAGKFFLFTFGRIGRLAGGDHLHGDEVWDVRHHRCELARPGRRHRRG